VRCLYVHVGHVDFMCLYMSQVVQRRGPRCVLRALSCNPRLIRFHGGFGDNGGGGGLVGGDYRSRNHCVKCFLFLVFVLTKDWRK
jgi:hypothetical protein